MESIDVGFWYVSPGAIAQDLEQGIHELARRRASLPRRACAGQHGTG